jgi:copper chaperone CopZ
VKVDLDSSQARATFDQSATSAEALCATVTDLGYPATMAGESSS